MITHPDAGWQESPPPPDAGELVRVRGSVWRVLQTTGFEDCAVIELAGVERFNLGARRRLLLPFDRPARVVRPRPLRMVRRRRWMIALRALVGDATPHDRLRTAARARIELFSYQLEPALAALAGLSTRFLLADEVGLGKTIQAGLLMAELRARGYADRTLVLTPAGLRDQWAGELSARFGIDAAVLDAASLRRRVMELPRGVNPWSIPAVTIASLDFVKRPEVLGPLEAVSWDLLLVDEAHSIANASERREAVRAIAARTRWVVLLTATPHGGDESAFSSLCDTGRLPGEGPIVMFRRSRADIGSPTRRRARILAIRPTAAEGRMHALVERYAARVWAEAARRTDRDAMLAMTVLCKRALSSASSLLRSIDRRLALLSGRDADREVQLSLALVPDAASAAEDLDAADAQPAGALGAPGLDHAYRERDWLLEIRAAAADASKAESKVRVLARLLRRLHEPAIVFTEYRDTLCHLEAAVGSSVCTAILHGGLTPDERREACERFNRGVSRVLLATDAAGEGLNLQARCRLVINMELPWNPMRLEQRAGRVDRLGQTRAVHAIHLLARQTAESRVLVRLTRRMEHVRAMLGAVHDPVGVMTEATIADAIIGRRPVDFAPGLARAGAADPPSNDCSLFTHGDVRTVAAEEEKRVRLVRRLLASRAPQAAGDDPSLPAIRAAHDTTGPWVTLLGRRRVLYPPGVVWIFRGRIIEGGGLIEEPLIAFHTAATQPVRSPTPLATRQWLTHLHQSLGPSLDRSAREQTKRRVAHLSAGPRLADALRQRNAGLAREAERLARIRSMLQLGLFEKRALRELTGAADARQESLGFDRPQPDGELSALADPELALVLILPRGAAGWSAS